jgi:hypothetical protein
MRRLLVLVCIAALTPAGEAGVERIEVLSRADVLDGRVFGEAGPYEKVSGKVHFAVKPEAAPNKLIVDLDKAPRNGAGEVEFSADFYLLRPKEAARASGAVLLEVPNRGGKGILAVMHGGKGSRDPATEEEFGDGFLMRRGVTVAWLGWQWDVREGEHMLRLYAPVARQRDGVATAGKKGKTSNAERPTSNVEVRGANPDSDAEISRALSSPSPDQGRSTDRGRPITGLVRADFTVNERQDEHPLGHFISGNIGGTEYACAAPDDPANVLTARDAPFAERHTIPRDDWSFTEDRRHVRMKGGFEPGKIYEVVYRAQDPAIAGLGFAAVRDFASYLKRERNELAPASKRVHALGISQSGRFLRHFLLEGFNADEAGKRAIDGMFIHVAGAGIGSFNHRFAQPSRDAQPTSALFYPTDLFPFTDAPQTDRETGKTAGLLDAVRIASGKDRGVGAAIPKIFHTNTSYEYWSRAGSLIHTSPDAKRDVPPVENARIYLLAGLQHFSRAFPPTPETEPSLAAQHLPNPNPVRWFWRALFVAMDDWVREGKSPPESRYPKIADGTLVRPHRRHSERSGAESKNPAAERKGNATGSLDSASGSARHDTVLKFPEIPVFRTVKEMSLRSLVRAPERVHDALRLDFGPQWKNRIITKQPPGVGKPFLALVPQVNEDGNEIAGVRLPQLEVPLATYTGWNLRDPKIGMPNERVSFLGSFFPLPKTQADAKAAGDPRRSIEERYPSREDYLRNFEEAAAKLAAAGYLLEEDIGALVARGAEEWDYVNRRSE